MVIHGRFGVDSMIEIFLRDFLSEVSANLWRKRMSIGGMGNRLRHYG